MKPTKEIQEAWKAEAEISGKSAICRKAQINSRTLDRGLDGKELRSYIYAAINSAVLGLRKRREKQEANLLDDNN